MPPPLPLDYSRRNWRENVNNPCYRWTFIEAFWYCCIFTILIFVNKIRFQSIPVLNISWTMWAPFFVISPCNRVNTKLFSQFFLPPENFVSCFSCDREFMRINGSSREGIQRNGFFCMTFAIRHQNPPPLKWHFFHPFLPLFSFAIESNI